ncbi:hypothetical protein DM813_26035 [Pseudomonas alkylphenolica]|uniref:Uncharacterized protein n=1 Tax=Pseudomonas alkylphenolica TaxID=237609 RepID=A0A443ZHF4_9PSED|nr:hypothetical protein [Pseudomonas alkylphenolica]RWU18124.1 hypothetical protein DM813_26035 [Pseudomonas alkylphenolica]
MLDNILFKSSGSHEKIIDVGALAEALIFYGKVRVLGDAGMVQYLVRKIPPLILIRLIESGRLEFYFNHDSLAVRSQQHYRGETHELVRFSLANVSYEDRAVQAFRQAVTSSQAKLAGYKFGRLVKKFEHESFGQKPVIEALAGSASTQAAVEMLIRNLAPEYTQVESYKFDINLLGGSRFTVDTNIDFLKVNQSYHLRVPPSHSTLNSALIVSRLQTAYASAFYGAAFDSEVFDSALDAALGLSALEGVLKRSAAGSKNVGEFVELTLENTYAIREAVNTGRVAFSEVMVLLESADKFRHWVAGVPNDKDLKSAYYQEVVKGSKFEKLPVKTSKWAGLTAVGLGLDLLGAGGFGTAAGVALGAADTFLLEKWAAGWKPSHFIEGDFKRVFGERQAAV